MFEISKLPVVDTVEFEESSGPIMMEKGPKSLDLVIDELNRVLSFVDWGSISEMPQYRRWPTCHLENFPAYRWLASYYVTGGAEGHYLHVDAITYDGERIPVMIEKTFRGREFAAAVANITAAILQA